MSPIQIVNYVVTVLQQFGLVPYIQGGLLVALVLAVVAMVRRALSNA